MRNEVLLIMGSKSDWPVVQKCAIVLKELGVPLMAGRPHVASAHRNPKKVEELSLAANDGNVGVIIAAAGMSAALPGVIKSHTVLPVVGLPIGSSTNPLDSQAALLSMTAMPAGIVVASVGINATENAALLAAEILAVNDPKLSAKLLERRKAQAAKVEEADAEMELEVMEWK
ncbi:AIR carboxylase family protein [Microgenomates group bacterium]|nr:AIR carboxylase family protein [Microgenomates group bacterium]